MGSSLFPSSEKCDNDFQRHDVECDKDDVRKDVHNYSFQKTILYNYTIFRKIKTTISAIVAFTLNGVPSNYQEVVK